MSKIFKSSCCHFGWLLSLVLLVISHSAFATGGVNVGNAGDWRKTLINHGKRGAANWVNSVATNLAVVEADHGPTKDSLSYRFMTRPGVLVQLAADIVTSQHVYNSELESVPGEYTSCAWTNDPTTPQLTDIVFSLKLCEGGLLLGGQKYANRLLIHESVHHLLLSKELRDVVGANFSGDDETQKRQEDELCDEIAEAIQRAFEAIELSEKTHWQDMVSPHNLGPEGALLQARGYHASAWTGNTGDTKTQSRMLVWGGCNQGTGGIIACGEGGYLGDGGIYDAATDQWLLMSHDGAPSPRAEPGYVWTGAHGIKEFQNQMIIWGGCTDGDGCERKLSDGAFYNLAADIWTPIASSGRAPAARVHHSVVWTGDRLIVWGGHPQDVAPFFAKPLNDGAIYDPHKKLWEELPPARFADGTVFEARGHHHSLWTGITSSPITTNKMLIWGGCVMEVADRCPQAFQDGAMYDPATKTWHRLITTGPIPEARHGHSFLYVPGQQKIYVFGGFGRRGNILADGAILDLNTMAWSPLANNAEGRVRHTAVWAGDRMLVFGGLRAEFSGMMSYETKVVSYIPDHTNKTKNGLWQTLAMDEIVPLKSIHHAAFWTGDAMIVWGGQTGEQQFTNLGSLLFVSPDSP